MKPTMFSKGYHIYKISDTDLFYINIISAEYMIKNYFIGHEIIEEWVDL